MTAEPRDVEEIRRDLATLKSATNDLAGMCSTQGRVDALTDLDGARSRLAADVAPLLARLAAADRENAELRAVIAATASDVERYVADRLADARQENAELRGEVEGLRAGRGSALADIRIYERQRDDLRAQLAAAQAQLAKHRDAMVAHMHRADAAEARLEAVRARAVAIMSSWNPGDPAYKAAQELYALALSAAPQPEPEVVGETLRVYRERARGQAVSDYDRISAEMRRVGYDKLSDADRAWVDDYRTARPDPWVTPASDEPARCEHGQTSPHAYFDVHANEWIICCPDPAASGTPDGGA